MKFYLMAPRTKILAPPLLSSPNIRVQETPWTKLSFKFRFLILVAVVRLFKLRKRKCKINLNHKMLKE